MTSITTDNHLNQIYSFALELLRPRKVETIAPIDPTLEFLRDEVLIELEIIFKVLPTLAGAVKRGLGHLDINEHAEALECFRQAEQSATPRVTSSANFQQKLWSVRILLFSTFYINGYFSDFYDLDSLTNASVEIFDKFVALPEVQTALHQELTPRSLFKMMIGSGSRNGRRHILAPVGSLHNVLRLATKRDYAVKKVDEHGLVERLSILRAARDEALQFLPVGERDTEVYALLLHQNRLYVGVGNGNIEVWDLAGPSKIGTADGHSERVTSLAVADGKLYSGAYDGTVRAWDLATLKETAVFKGHTDWIHAVAVVDNRLFSASEDHTVRVWDLVSGAEITAFTEHSEGVLSLTVSENRLFTGSKNSTIKVYDLSTLAVVNTLSGVEAPIASLAVHNDLVYAGAGDGTIHVWNLTTLAKVTTLANHKAAVHALYATDDRLYSGGADNNIIVWDIDIMLKSNGENNEKANFTAHSSPVRAIVASGGRLYSASDDKSVKVWDLNPWAQEDK